MEQYEILSFAKTFLFATIASMLFTAKIVEDRLAGKVMIGIVATGFAFIIICLAVKELNGVLPFLFSVLLLSIIVVAVIAKGDLSIYQTVKTLQVFTDRMQIGQLVFPFTEMKTLGFEFQSYELVTTTYRGRPNYESYGLGNNLSFIYKNQTFHYQFHLHSLQHYRAFVQMLEVLYENGVSFWERNLNGPTYLMRNVNEEQLLLLRRQYGGKL